MRCIVPFESKPPGTRAATRPEGRVKLGSFLAAIFREVGGLIDEEHALVESARMKSSARAACGYRAHASAGKRLLPMFANRVLSFDMACTKAYTHLQFRWVYASAAG